MNREVPLTVLRAQEGTGKSTLLADWVRTQRRPVVWVNLGPDVTDRGTFWDIVATAMRDSGVLSSKEVLAIEPTTDPARLRRRLVRSLSGIAERCVVVIDNAEVVASHEELGGELAADWYAILRATGALRLVVASRWITHLEDLRIAQRIDHTFLHYADLRFTPEEVTELLGALEGPDRTWSDNSVTAQVMHESTGGSPGLMKAVLMAARASQVEGAGEIRTLAHQITRSWIRSEVEDPAQAALMRFLLRISVPEVLPPGLPEHLDNGNGTTAQQLTMLEEKGIISIDPTTLVAAVDPVSLPHVRA